MKIKRVIVMLTILCLVAIPTLAKKDPGELGPPENLTVTPALATIDGEDDVPVFYLDWDDVEDPDADKYSVDVTAMAMADTGLLDEDENPIWIELEMSASFGTSDRLDGGDMSDSDLNIPVADIEALVADLQDYLDYLIGEGLILSADPIEVTAKVKALDPSVKPTKRQNNPFSDPEPVPLL